MTAGLSDIVGASLGGTGNELLGADVGSVVSAILNPLRGPPGGTHNVSHENLISGGLDNPSEGVLPRQNAVGDLNRGERHSLSLRVSAAVASALT